MIGIFYGIFTIQSFGLDYSTWNKMNAKNFVHKMKEQDKEYIGPREVKFISAKRKNFLVENDFWTKTNKKKNFEKKLLIFK